ncbi:MAG TPA: hypothetical protein VJS92_07600, partial [Candidatus Polarisedimenticolaceae bacterium]|nr:hypothetical protein [Candidatus Polarisedimenticolaceae bacterium]
MSTEPPHDVAASRRPGTLTRLLEGARHASDRLLAANLLWSGLFAGLLALLLGNQSCGASVARIGAGDVAPHDVRAASELQLVDELRTEADRRRAREAVPDVYVHDTEWRLRMTRQLAELFAQGRRALDDPSTLESLAGRAPPAALRLLAELRFDPALERELAATLSATMRGPVVSNKAVLLRQPSIQLIRLPGGEAETLSDYAEILELDEAHELVRRELASRLRLPRAQQALLAELVDSFVDANVHLDWGTTQTRREAAAAAVPRQLRHVARGELLVRQGE